MKRPFAVPSGDKFLQSGAESQHRKAVLCREEFLSILQLNAVCHLCKHEKAPNMKHDIMLIVPIMPTGTDQRLSALLCLLSPELS